MTGKEDVLIPSLNDNGDEQIRAISGTFSLHTSFAVSPEDPVTSEVFPDNLLKESELDNHALRSSHSTILSTMQTTIQSTAGKYPHNELDTSELDNNEKNPFVPLLTTSSITTKTSRNSPSDSQETFLDARVESLNSSQTRSESPEARMDSTTPPGTHAELMGVSKTRVQLLESNDTSFEPMEIPFSTYARGKRLKSPDTLPKSKEPIDTRIESLKSIDASTESVESNDEVRGSYESSATGVEFLKNFDEDSDRPQSPICSSIENDMHIPIIEEGLKIQLQERFVEDGDVLPVQSSPTLQTDENTCSEGKDGRFDQFGSEEEGMECSSRDLLRERSNQTSVNEVQVGNGSSREVFEAFNHEILKKLDESIHNQQSQSPKWSDQSLSHGSICEDDSNLELRKNTCDFLVNNVKNNILEGEQSLSDHCRNHNSASDRRVSIGRQVQCSIPNTKMGRDTGEMQLFREFEGKKQSSRRKDEIPGEMTAIQGENTSGKQCRGSGEGRICTYEVHHHFAESIINSQLHSARGTNIFHGRNTNLSDDITKTSLKCEGKCCDISEDTLEGNMQRSKKGIQEPNSNEKIEGNIKQKSDSPSATFLDNVTSELKASNTTTRVFGEKANLVDDMTSDISTHLIMNLARDLAVDFPEPVKSCSNTKEQVIVSQTSEKHHTETISISKVWDFIVSHRAFILIFLVLGLLFTASSLSHSEKVEFTILTTNDLHSHLEGSGPQSDLLESRGHFARIAYLFRRIQDEHPNSTLTLDAGDWFCGSMFSMLGISYMFPHLLPELQFLQYTRYDATTIGNHEMVDENAEFGSMMEKYWKSSRIPHYYGIPMELDSSIWGKEESESSNEEKLRVSEEYETDKSPSTTSQKQSQIHGETIVGAIPILSTNVDFYGKCHHLNNYASWTKEAVRNESSDDELLTNPRQKNYKAQTSHAKYELPAAFERKYSDTLFHRYILKHIQSRDQKSSLKVGILSAYGVNAADISQTTRQNCMVGIGFNDKTRKIEWKKYVNHIFESALSLRENHGAEFIILVAHEGEPYNTKLVKSLKNLTLKRMGYYVPVVNIIVASHTHATYSKMVDKVQIIQAGANGEYVGILRIQFDKLSSDLKILNPLYNTKSARLQKGNRTDVHVGNSINASKEEKKDDKEINSKQGRANYSWGSQNESPIPEIRDVAALKDFEDILYDTVHPSKTESNTHPEVHKARAKNDDALESIERNSIQSTALGLDELPQIMPIDSSIPYDQNVLHMINYYKEIIDKYFLKENPFSFDDQLGFLDTSAMSQKNDLTQYIANCIHSEIDLELRQKNEPQIDVYYLGNALVRYDPQDSLFTRNLTFSDVHRILGYGFMTKHITSDNLVRSFGDRIAHFYLTLDDYVKVEEARYYASWYKQKYMFHASKLKLNTTLRPLGIPFYNRIRVESHNGETISKDRLIHVGISESALVFFKRFKEYSFGLVDPVLRDRYGRVKSENSLDQQEYILFAKCIARGKKRFDESRSENTTSNDSRYNDSTNYDSRNNDSTSNDSRYNDSTNYDSTNYDSTNFDSITNESRKDIENSASWNDESGQRQQEKQL